MITMLFKHCLRVYMELFKCNLHTNDTVISLLSPRGGGGEFFPEASVRGLNREGGIFQINTKNLILFYL